jgi:hypothetical protein
MENERKEDSANKGIRNANKQKKKLIKKTGCEHICCVVTGSDELPVGSFSGGGWVLVLVFGVCRLRSLRAGNRAERKKKDKKSEKTNKQTQKQKTGLERQHSPPNPLPPSSSFLFISVLRLLVLLFWRRQPFSSAFA